MSWLKLELEVTHDQVDALGDLLLELGAACASVGPVQETQAERVFEPAPGAMPLWPHCTLSALVPLDADLHRLRVALARYPVRIGGADFVADEDWPSRWREHTRKRCFGGRLWLLPRDADPEPGPSLRLDPGLAFGSGSHPTTQLCLEWLAAQDLRAKRVLDYGCGSGVLALSARVLGASEVVAVDHDPQALAASLDNARFNELTRGVRVGEPASVDGDRFDVVVANILAGTLIELAPRLTGLVRRGGVLVLSGVLQRQTSEVAAAYAAFAFDPPQVAQDDWICLVGRCARGSAPA